MSSAVVEQKQTPEPRVITTELRFTDKVFRGVVTGGGLISLAILGLIGFFLIYNGFEAIRNAGLAFLTGFDWVDAVPENEQLASYGIGAMLYGTIVTGILAMIMGVPIAVGTALFLSYYAPEWLKKPMVVVVDVMAAIPSIVYGLWGFFVLMPHAEYWAKLIHKYFGFIPFFDMPAPVFTRSPFIAGLVLAIMITPIVTAIAREVFAQTPLERIQAAYALGATKWSMIKAVVFPYGRGGVVGGAMLGLGRALGETVAVYTVLNLVYDIRIEVLLSAGGNVASMIVNKFGEADFVELQALMAAGFVLFLVTLMVNFLANYIINKTARE
ncbi:phosphate transport system permease protein [Candidatus Nanopelagicus hibericus]|uniref:Phosphate transport system permease protein n=1 Tax=Candidatus Nanopelagicus hibericus TaxID=1884915 RepID=A0A249K9Z1_9ACTN|nr:phosphate ABC transporter permease subunit PstC [Candidatus Nanopelagicus hibericus]ASY13601.1 phosphate transport system permease protein [Candidatus Nanopelagicus hibericus]